MYSISIQTDARDAINIMINEVSKALLKDEEIRVYFLFSEELFVQLRSALRRKLKGVAYVRSSPRRMVCGIRHYGLDFYPDNSLRNDLICKGLNAFKQL